MSENAMYVLKFVFSNTMPRTKEILLFKKLHSENLLIAMSCTSNDILVLV